MGSTDLGRCSRDIHSSQSQRAARPRCRVLLSSCPPLPSTITQRQDGSSVSYGTTGRPSRETVLFCSLVILSAHRPRLHTPLNFHCRPVFRAPNKATDLAAAIDSIAHMPRPNPPPTPGSSTDLRGKEGEAYAPAFRLPPTAYYEDADGASNRSSSTPSANGSDESYRPASPAGDAPRSTKVAVETGVMTRKDSALPPPPTRSRKIIQMRPQTAKPTQEGAGASAVRVSPQAATRGQTAVTGGGKRKGNASGQTAAGRKTARKTAHSLIERRRRSKMNDEFGVLRDMIPACRGQEMHKLAILQVRTTSCVLREGLR